MSTSHFAALFYQMTTFKEQIIFFLLFVISANEGIQMAVLLSFASEGNNAGDGLGLAKYTNQWINMVCNRYNIK